MKYTFDAKNKKLGRLASEIAVILQGKNSPSYEQRADNTNVVTVENVKDIVLTGNKESEKVYYRHAGMLGHLKIRKFKDVQHKDPAWVLRHAVNLMLPKNKLRAKRMKRLIVK